MYIFKCLRSGISMLENRMKWSDTHGCVYVTLFWMWQAQMQTDRYDKWRGFSKRETTPVKVPNKLKNNLASIYTVVASLKTSVILRLSKKHKIDFLKKHCVPISETELGSWPRSQWTGFLSLWLPSRTLKSPEIQTGFSFWGRESYPWQDVKILYSCPSYSRDAP